jgi:hypothetical protein
VLAAQQSVLTPQHPSATYRHFSPPPCAQVADRVDATNQQLQVRSTTAFTPHHAQHVSQTSCPTLDPVNDSFPSLELSHVDCQWALSSEERRAVITRRMAAAAALGDVDGVGECLQARMRMGSADDCGWD